MTRTLRPIPESSNKDFWGDADIRNVTPETSTVSPDEIIWKRYGMMARATNTPYDLSISVDWDKMTIKDGKLVSR
jgi:hypothetical protein